MMWSVFRCLQKGWIRRRTLFKSKSGRLDLVHLRSWIGDERTEIFHTLWVIFPPATLLDWALWGDPSEGIEDRKEAFPWKVKGRRELLNIECSINYDSKGASSKHGKSKAHAF